MMTNNKNNKTSCNHMVLVFGTRAKARGVPYIPHVPAYIGAANLRVRQLPVQPVRKQQHVMLHNNDRVNQDVLQHNTTTR